MAAFTPGNIVVYRVGAVGGGTLSAAATAVFLDEYTPTGVLVQSIALPTLDNGLNQTLTAAGNSTAEGLLNRSADGRYLVLTGYDAAPGTATVAGSPSTIVNRVIGRVAADGTVDTTTTTTAFSGGNIRSATSLDGTGFWAGGSNTGVIYQTFGAVGAGTTVLGVPSNIRDVMIYNGQLYGSSMSGAFTNVYTIGTGTPTTPGQTATSLPGLPTSTASPYQFVLLDLDAGVAGVDTLYIADDRSIASGGGLQKWISNGASWTLVSTTAVGPAGLRGLTASVSGTTVTLFTTTTTASANAIFSATDTAGYGAAFSGPVTLVATAAANTAFRGVALAPQGAVAANETIAVATPTLTQNEGDTVTTAFVYTLTRTGSTAAAATVTFAVAAAAGTTTLDGTDFAGGTLPTGIATFAPGSSVATVTINVAGDRTIEGDEGFTLTLANPSPGYTIGAGTANGTIVNDDVAGTVSVADVSIAEGAGQAVVTFVRSGGSGDASVFFTTADGTATAGSDYTPNSGGATFANGNNSVQIFVTLANDTAAEGNETFVLNLSPGVGGPALANGTATVTIVDNDFAVNIADATVNEGAGTVTLTLTRNSGDGDVSVNYVTTSGTAQAISDFTPQSGTVTFTGTQQTATIVVPITNDTAAEPTETFTVDLTAAAGAPTLLRNGATVTIIDNDVAQPGSFQIAPGAQSVAEGAAGATTAFTFTVIRADGSDGAVDVPYTILFNGTDATDFAATQPLSGVVSFANGDAAAKTVTVQVAGDNAVEPNEGFTVRLGTPTAGTLGAQRDAVATIANDDAAYTLAAGSGAEAAGVSLVVTRTGDTSQAATLSWTASLAGGNTATAADFAGGVLPSGTVSFVAGAATATILVPVLNDAAIEGDETFTVTLSGAGGNATIATATATGTIVNDDFPALSISDPSVVEGGIGGTAVLRYTVTASAPAPAGGIGFTIATADGTATAGSDYVARSTTGTIAAGQTTYAFDVQVIGDVAPERAETVLVNLSAPVNAAIADAQGSGFIDNDDGAPAGLQDYFSAAFIGFTAAGFAPVPTAAQLDSDVWRVVGLSDNTSPVFGGTYTTGDFARGIINGTADPVTAGVYSPSANAALVIQPTTAELANGGFIEAQLVNTTGFTATSFSLDFDWAYRNSGDRGSRLTLSYSTDGSTFVSVPEAAFTTPAARDTATAATFSLMHQAVTIGGVLVGDGNPLFLRWTHNDATGSGNRDEVGIDNVIVRAVVSDIQTLSAGDIQVVEGTGGQSFATFTVTRSSGTGTASIAYATADGTALAGRDYTAQSGTLTFAEGERSKTVSVAISTDAANESAETFFLNLTSPVGVSVTDAQARAVILNDDNGPVGIFDIQGAGHASPFAGQSITTGGIVTAISANSFWLQDLVGDGLFATSDAIQVFFGAAPTGVAVGNLVTVTATVTEFVPTTGALSVTELTAPTFTVTGTGTLPGAIVIGANGGILPPTNIIDDDGFRVFDPLNDGIDFYEALEGMLVTVQAPIVTASTTENGSGVRTTYIVASGGVGATNVNDRGGITLTGDDAAPERIQVFGAPSLVPSSTTGDILGDVTGILTYFSFPELLPTQAITVTRDTNPTQEQTTLVGDADRLLIATFNIENADPGDPQAKFDAIATEVIAGLGRPDIIGLQEVQDADGAGAGTNLSGQATADKIIAAILAAGGPTYTYIEIAPTVANTTGGEPGGNIRNGYLYNAARVAYVDGSATLIDTPTYAGTRRPLVAQFVFNEATVTVINAHSTSRGGSDLSFGANQPPAQAGDAARTAQAAGIKAYIDNLQAADPTARVVALGDFNGYYYETALRQLTDGGTMTNLFTLLPVAERYTYVFESASQAFDNIIVTNNLVPGTQFDVVHYNAEQTAQPVTDHDQSVAALFIPRPNTAPSDLTIDNAAVAENAAAGTLVGTVTGVDAQGGTLTYALTDNAGGRFAIDATTGRLTTTQPFDFEATPGANVTVRVTDSGGLSYSETLAIAVTNVNEAPGAPTTGPASVAENAAAGTLVATATATDPDGTTPTFSLVDNAGGLFAIDATTGRITTTAPLDFESRPTASITVRASDAGGLFADSVVSVAVTNVNEAPATLALSGSTVAENAPAGTVVGTLAATDPDAGGGLSYSLADNGGGRFAVNAATGQVTTTQPLDYEAVRSVAITGRVTDQGGLTLDRMFTIAVTNVNEAPAGLALTGTTVAENAPAGTTVGTAAATDPEGDTLRYSFAANPGELFAIDAATGRLTVAQPLNYEAAATRGVTIRATDTGGLFVDRAVTIAVTDVNEAPAGVTISSATVTENAAGGTVVGTLSGNDPDAGDALTYRLGSSDTRFVINGNQLAVAAGAAIDFETEQTIALAVTATDRAGLATTSTISLAVQDVAETFPGTAGNDTITGDGGPNTINGGAGDDMIFGRGGADVIDGGDGNDTINGGAGADRITLGAGADTVRALLAELLGDTIVDFTAADRIVVQNSDIKRVDFQVNATGLQFAGGTIALPSPRTGGDFMAAHVGLDSVLTFNPFLAAVEDKKSVDATAINGIVNQPYLAGDNAGSFTVNVESIARAKFSNTLGVYEINMTTGAISDVRIIAANVKNAGSITVTGVDPGNQLGFFIVQDGANKLSSGVLSSTGLSLISQGGSLVLANNGAAVGGVTTFFSHSAAANADGQVHVLSGVAADGSGALRIGFEDLARPGGDNDFQDVVITVAAVSQPRPTADAAHPFAIADVTDAPVIADMGLVPLSAGDVAVLHG